MNFQQQAWCQFAHETGGEFVKGDPWWKFFSRKRDKLIIPVNPWTLTFDTALVGTDDCTLVTRARAPYVGKGEFMFAIRRKGWSRKVISKLIVDIDIVVGHSDFDRKFRVKGNDESKVRALLADASVRRSVESLLSSEYSLDLKTEIVRRFDPAIGVKPILS